MGAVLPHLAMNEDSPLTSPNGQGTKTDNDKHNTQSRPYGDPQYGLFHCSAPLQVESGQ